METSRVTDAVYLTKNDPNFKCSDAALSDDSSKDARWDEGRKATELFSQFLFAANAFEKWAHRTHDCTGLLKFAEQVDPATGEIALKLRYADFCGCRHCPMCQHRRVIVYRSRFLTFLPPILAEHPNARWVFLTLTVPNVPVGKLRVTLSNMNTAWQRFVKRKEFKPVLGWIRTTEVTREAKRKGYAHPHFHCLMMVRPSFFGKDYVKQAQWAEIWGDCLRLAIVPRVDIRVMKGGIENLLSETVKTFTYSVKPEALVADPEWTLEYFKQVHKLRFIAAGGALKEAIKRLEPETNKEMIYTDDNPKLEHPEKELSQRAYSWRRQELKYRRCVKAEKSVDK